MALFSRSKPRTEGVSDPAKLLIMDHQKVERIFEQIEAAKKPNQAQGLVSQLTFELERHTEIEEQILYPFIRAEVPGGDEMMNEAEEEHAQAKTVLAMISTLDFDSPDFGPTLKQLKALVEHHVKEEENDVFPKLDDSVDAPALNRLRGELEQAKLEATPSPTLPDDNAPTGGSRSRSRSGGSSASKSKSRPSNRTKSSSSTSRSSTAAKRSTQRVEGKAEAVLVRKRDDGQWEVRRENASRATKLFSNKREAEKFGRGVAKNNDAPLKVS